MPTGAQAQNATEARVALLFLRAVTLLNAESIKECYDFAYIRFPFARIDEFRCLERESRATPDYGRVELLYSLTR
jgi:hypothetical protein